MMNYLVNMNKHLRIGFFISAVLVFFVIFISTGNGVFILLSIIFLGLLIYSNLYYSKNYSKIMEKSLDFALSDCSFQTDMSYLSDDYLSGIAINKIKRKIVVFKRIDKMDNFIPYIYDFNDILECSIQEDGDTVIKTINSSLIGRSIAGGVLFGGIGAAIGGLTSEKIAREKIYRVSLSLTFNDIDYPIRKIDFLNSKMLIERNSEIYKYIREDLNKWYKTISVIIRNNEKELNSNTV